MKKFILISCLLAGSQFALASSITKEFKKTVDFEEEGIIEVENVNGQTEVTSWAESQVDIYAEIEVKSGSAGIAREFMEKVRIDIDQLGDRLKIEPKYPKSSGGDFFDWIFGDRKPSVKIDLYIKVPKKAGIELHSVNGSVHASEIGGEAKLSSVNGRILAENMYNSVRAGTTNGSIDVDLAESLSTNDMRFETVNGSIKLSLPNDVQADVEASTVNGSMHTDFALQVSGQWNSKNIHGTINGGGQGIYLKTVNGSISLQERKNGL